MPGPVISPTMPTAARHVIHQGQRDSVSAYDTHNQVNGQTVDASHHDNGASCSCHICFSDMTVPEFTSPESGDFKCGLTSDGRQVRLACGHAYCKDCAEDLLEKGSHDCPTCRKPIEARDLETINKDLGTNFKSRTARDVMNDVINDDRRNGRNDEISRENRGLWGCDVIHTENERNPRRAQREAPALHTAFLDDLLSEFVHLGLLGNTFAAAPPRPEPTPVNELESWFDNIVDEEALDFSSPEPEEIPAVVHYEQPAYLEPEYRSFFHRPESPFRFWQLTDAYTPWSQLSGLFRVSFPAFSSPWQNYQSPLAAFFPFQTSIFAF